ncbi:DUF1516 family protein, partial [Bacillus thuringiensis]|uniref:DUF1516 family protein n=1 Tax=Bacillus thuringiensis TaxID=1428 RepID=UPI003BFA6703
MTPSPLPLILFFLPYSLYSPPTKAKPLHIPLPLIYIIIILTPFIFYIPIMNTPTTNIHISYGLKMIPGILLIPRMQILLL